MVERARLVNGDRAALVDKKELFLETVPKAGEGLITFSRRVAGSSSHAAAIGKANGNPKRLLSGVRYRVPFRLVSSDSQLAVIRALFPGDKGGSDGWVHHTRGEALEQVAEWFTSGAGTVATLRKTNKLGSGRLRAQTRLRIPNEILRIPFRAAAPAAAAAPAPPPYPTPTTLTPPPRTTTPHPPNPPPQTPNPKFLKMIFLIKIINIFYN